MASAGQGEREPGAFPERHGVFPLAVAAPLAHAQAHRVAARIGVRALSIKGAVSDAYGLRAPHVAADADLLVEPDGFDALCAAMAPHGWHPRVERATPALIAQHTRTLIDPVWPCDIDLHHYFPGFFGDPAAVFERLWGRRRRLFIAHAPAWAVSRTDAAVIMALHAVRYSRDPRHLAEGARIREAIREEFSVSERAAVLQTARIGRAQWVLRDILAGVVELETDASEEEQRRWSLNQRTIEDGSASSWLDALRRAPWGGKSAILTRALWISRADIPRNDPTVMPTRTQAWAFRIERLGRGIRVLGGYRRQQHDR